MSSLGEGVMCPQLERGSRVLSRRGGHVSSIERGHVSSLGEGVTCPQIERGHVSSLGGVTCP